MICCGVYTWLIMYCFGKYYSMLYVILYSPRRAGQHWEAEHQHLGRRAVLLIHLRACGVVAANGRAGGFRSQPSPRASNACAIHPLPRHLLKAMPCVLGREKPQTKANERSAFKIS